jgi:hypothetical protein
MDRIFRIDGIGRKGVNHSPETHPVNPENPVNPV